MEDYYEFYELCQSTDYKFESILFAANTADCRTKWNIEKMTTITTTPEQLPSETQTLTTAHDGVIVVGNDPQNSNRDGQDILLMVELKYKDVLDPQSTTVLKGKQDKGLYQTNLLPEKELIFPLPQSVLRHSDEFHHQKLPPPKLDSEIDEELNLVEEVTYADAQTFTDQPMELVDKDPSNDSLAETNDSNSNSNEVIKCVSKDKPFPCSHCDKAFMRRSNLNAHMSIHTQVKPFNCEQCDQSFALKWNLTVHQRIHTGTYSCEFCGKAFPVKGKLDRHRRIHTGEKPFVCPLPECDKAFADKRNLEAHIKTHSEERPFVCNQCGRAFRSRSHVADHQRVHSVATPYICGTCGKSFKWKTNLTIHMKGHSGEKFVCVDCGQEFVRSSQLVKHRKVNHSSNNNPSQPMGTINIITII